MAHDVFLSHSSKDKPTADAVCATLEARGIRCWVAPRDIVPGSDWGESIIEAIGTSKVMVLVFSDHANESVQIKREIERAVSKGVVIVPFRIEEVQPSKALEYFLSTPHWLDAYTPPMEQHLGYLADTVAHILSGAGTELKPPPLRPKPVPFWRKPATIAGMVAVALIAFFVLKPGPSIEKQIQGKWKLASFTRDTETPLPNANTLANLLEAAIDANDVSGTLDIDSSAEATMTITATDTGTLSASSDHLNFRSSHKGVEDSATYVVSDSIDADMARSLDVKPGERMLSLQGSALATADPQRSSAHPVVGTWHATFAMPGGSWYMNVDIKRTGAYTIEFTRKVKGEVTIAKTRMTLEGSGVSFRGAFSLKDGQLTTPDYSAKAAWKRA